MPTEVDHPGRRRGTEAGGFFCGLARARVRHLEQGAMAVIVEGYSVIVRNSTLAAKYRGGIEGYRRDCPNATFCSDAHLSRIGFMVHRDADVFVARLAAHGLMPYRKGAAEDIALVCQSD